MAEDAGLSAPFGVVSADAGFTPALVVGPWGCVFFGVVVILNLRFNIIRRPHSANEGYRQQATRVQDAHNSLQRRDK